MKRSRKKFLSAAITLSLALGMSGTALAANTNLFGAASTATGDVYGPGEVTIIDACKVTVNSNKVTTDPTISTLTGADFVVTSGDTWGGIFGGYTTTGGEEVTGNTVKITAGTINGKTAVNASSRNLGVVGGYYDVTAGNANANSNKVIIGDGSGDITIKGRVNGGYAYTSAANCTATASYNEVDLVNNGNYTTNINADVAVCGGFAHNNATTSGGAIANLNKITFNGVTVTGKGGVFGAEADVWYGDGNAEASENSVSISGGSVSGSIEGALATVANGTATAKKNSIVLKGVVASDEVRGGEAAAYGSGNAEASENSVSISGKSEIKKDVVAAWVRTYGDNCKASAVNNNIIISGGTASGDLDGGEVYAYAAGSTAESSSNTVTITGGSGKTVYGGYVKSNNGTAIANGNTVNIGGTYDANSNTITYLNGSEDINLTSATLYGGYIQSSSNISNEKHSSADNTLNIFKAVKVKAIGMASPNITKFTGLNSFQNMNFYIPATATTGDTMLTVTDALNLDGVTINTVTSNYTPGNKITLLSDTSISKLDKDKLQVNGTTVGTGKHDYVDAKINGMSNVMLKDAEYTFNDGTTLKEIYFNSANYYTLKDNSTVTGAVVLNASINTSSNPSTYSITINSGASLNAKKGIYTSGKVTNNGTFTTTANGITGGIENNNKLTLTGGTADQSADLGSSISGTGTTTIDGYVNVKADQTIANKVTVNTNKSLTNNGTISGEVTNNGLLTTTANGITGGIVNYDKLILTGGTAEKSDDLGSNISGNGTTTINGYVKVNDGQTIANEVIIKSGQSLANNGTISGEVTNKGTFTTTANGITGGVDNYNKLTLTGGTAGSPIALGSDISGTGTTTINGDVISNKTIANNVTVNDSKSLTNTGTISGTVANNGTVMNTGTISGKVTNNGTFTTAADDITGGVENNKDMTVTGGESGSPIALGSDISGTGTTTISGDVTSSKTIQNDLVIAAGNSLTNTGAITGKVTDNGTLINNGTLNTKDGTSLAGLSGIGTTTISDGATNVTGNFTQNGLTVNKGASYSQTSGTFVVNGDVITEKGEGTIKVTLSNLTGTDNKITGKLTNDGTFEIKNTTLTINEFTGNKVIFDAASKLTILGNVNIEDLCGNADNPDNPATLDLKSEAVLSGESEVKIVDYGKITVASSSSDPKTAGQNNDSVFAQQINKATRKLGSTAITNSSVNIGEGRLQGAMAISYDADGNQTYAETAPNQTNVNMLDAIAGTASYGRIETNDIRRRLGDVRLANAESGIWARMENGRLENSSIGSNFHKYQMGYDKAVSDKWRVGGAFSYTKSSAGFSTGGMDNDTYSLAGYGMYTGKKGEFLDIIGRLGTSKMDVNNIYANGKLSTPSVALSAEIGKTYALKNNLFFEPQAEIMYTHSNGDSFTDTGYAYDLSGQNSFNARLGFTFGYKAPNGAGEIYTRLSALHEFEGDRDMNITGPVSKKYSYDGADTWWEWAIGGQIRTSKATYLYADVEKTFGAHMDEKYRLNVGFRYSF